MFFTDLATFNKLNDFLLQILRQNLTVEAIQWLQDKAERIATEDKSVQLHLSFSHLPRITSRKNISLGGGEADRISKLLPGFAIDTWTMDRLGRVWLLMQLPADNREGYIRKIKSLFIAAEMNEQIALYSALPIFLYPEEWVTQCEEGIRSNIGTVLEAIMYHNPYPAKFLSELAWNQLILKAFFTEKDVNLITGLKDRANDALSSTLQDYIRERLAADRTVAPEIYELTQQMNQQ